MKESRLREIIREELLKEGDMWRRSIDDMVHKTVGSIWDIKHPSYYTYKLFFDNEKDLKKFVKAWKSNSGWKKTGLDIKKVRYEKQDMFQLIIDFDPAHHRFESIEEKKVVKSPSAKKVLQLMDKYEDGADRYGEFVKKVAKQDKISVQQLEKELDPFI